MTGNSVVADELELSFLNSVLGMHSPTGRWATYNTPMSGVRVASAQQIVFQSREGSPELNCCSVNAPRGFGLLSEWAVMGDAEGLRLNYYGPCSMTIPLRKSLRVGIQQKTRYPVSGRINIAVNPSKTASFCLKLRIPAWSARTKVRVNGTPVPDVVAGSYLELDRTWRKGDTVQLDLDMSLHLWPGEKECDGLASIYRGPILLTYDHRYNLHLAAGKKLRMRTIDLGKGTTQAELKVPVLDARQLKGRTLKWEEWFAPLMLIELETAGGKAVRLCDFASAGMTGTPYTSWLPMRHAGASVPFQQNRPLRTVRGS